MEIKNNKEISQINKIKNKDDKNVIKKEENTKINEDKDINETAFNIEVNEDLNNNNNQIENKNKNKESKKEKIKETENKQVKQDNNVVKNNIKNEPKKEKKKVKENKNFIIDEEDNEEKDKKEIKKNDIKENKNNIIKEKKIEKKEEQKEQKEKKPEKKEINIKNNQNKLKENNEKINITKKEVEEPNEEDIDIDFDDNKININEKPENLLKQNPNNKNTNQELIDIFTEIKEINNSNQDKNNKNVINIRKKSSSSDEEIIIKNKPKKNNNEINIINNDDEINDIKIENDFDKPKKVEIIENYFDFRMHDIDLVKIESYYKTYKNITKEDSKIIKLLLTKYNKFISENLNQTTYPYLINSIKPNFQTLETDLKQKFFLIQVLRSKNTIKKKLFSYFKNLTRINLYGVSDKLKTFFNKDVVENKGFEIFSEKLAKWHCHVEMIVLYLDLLANLFNEHFDFDKKKFSLENNFKNNTDILIKKNFYKLASKICSKISLNPGIDYMKLLTFALTIVTTGVGGAGGVVPLTISFSQQQIAKIIGIFGLNFLTQKASDKLSEEGEMQEFNALSDLVEKLNSSLLKIEKTCYRLIILELQEEIYSNIETSQVDVDISKKKEEIAKLLETFLKGVECPEDIDKLIEEEYVQLNTSIIEEKYDNDWIVQHLSINEVKDQNENNNNNNNSNNNGNNNSNNNQINKINNDSDNIFDDFVDINKDDL